MVRGELISQASKLKAALDGELQTLLIKIQSAELKTQMSHELVAEIQSLHL